MKKLPTTRDVMNRITNPIRTATKGEKSLLSKALGLNSAKKTEFESHGGDIIGGEILPNMHITASGVSPMEAVGNVINVELARIRGQLKRVPLEDLYL